MKEEKQLNKTVDFEKDSSSAESSPKPESFLLKEPINHISTIEHRAVLRTNIILDYIKKNPNITPYRLSKDLEIDYSTISRTINDLIYCKAISFRVEIGENNRTHKLLFVPEEGLK